MEWKLEIGCVVTFVDSRYKAHEALVTAIHGDPLGRTADARIETEDGTVGGRDPGSNWPCINLVHVVAEEDQQDQYGRQTKHESSVVHISHSSAGGFCWQWSDEEHTVKVNTIS